MVFPLPFLPIFTGIASGVAKFFGNRRQREKRQDQLAFERNKQINERIANQERFRQQELNENKDYRIYQDKRDFFFGNSDLSGVSYDLIEEKDNDKFALDEETRLKNHEFNQNIINQNISNIDSAMNDNDSMVGDIVSAGASAFNTYASTNSYLSNTSGSLAKYFSSKE